MPHLLIDCGTHTHRVDAAQSDDPMDLYGFLAFEAYLIAQLLKTSKGPRDSMERDLLDLLSGFDLGNLSETDKQRILNQTERLINRYADAVVKRASDQVTASQRRIGRQVSYSVGKKIQTDIRFSWNQQRVAWTERDNAAMNWLGQNNALFAGKYFRGSDGLIKKARNIVTRDYSLYGDNREAIATRVKDGLVSMAEATDNYWRVFATNALNNARSFSAIREMNRRGVTRYRIKAVLDSRTTTICRFMDGREFSVSRAVPVFDSISTAQNVDELDRVSPMVRDITGTDGKPTGTYVIGKGDSEQVFGASATESDLTRMGVMFPPFHFNCRSTVEIA